MCSALKRPLFLPGLRQIRIFHSSDLDVRPVAPAELKPKPLLKEIEFGKLFTDHMLTIAWKSTSGWARPVIGPLRPLQIHPCAKVLHYAIELFEGMKAYRGVDDRIRLFRPMHNMTRMNSTAKRACLPTFQPEELLTCIRRLVQLDQEWVPHSESSSLYIRPSLIGTEPQLGIGESHEALLFVVLSPTGPYFSKVGLQPVNLMADPAFVRAFPGGSGYAKMGSNYAPTIWIQKMAALKGCHQCLWLHGEDHELTEVGAMNIFVLLVDSQGNRELVTPPLDSGIILPGITRQSILELTRTWNEFQVSERKITMSELLTARSEGKLEEIFGSGTAAIVSPVGSIHYQGQMMAMPVDFSPKAVSQRILKGLTDIYYGRVKDHPWTMDLETWVLDPNEKQRIQEYQQFMEVKMKSLSL